MIFTASPKRILLWILISLAVMAVFTGSFWVEFLKMLSFEYILGRHRASSFGMLLLCALFLMGGKKQLKEQTVRRCRKKDLCFILFAGPALLAAAVLLPPEQDYMILKPALALAGAFALVFGQTARIPLLTLMVYSGAIFFPVLVERYFETGYARAALAPAEGLAQLLGLPLAVDGQLAGIVTAEGQPVTVTVTAACAGPATMGVFLGLFALMYLDLPIPVGRALAVLFFGIAGTWAQSIIRILVIMEAGFKLGEKALWAAHFWTIYLLFPAWYLVFALVYLKQAGTGRMSQAAG
ncbi:MAG: hypothetical protein M1609_08790 [Firmicutes bacterium]|nr:hypothetical protein [Bacillota bacterium]